jgi:hypothetical protein
MPPPFIVLLRSMNNFELCRDISMLHKSIFGAGIIEEAKFVAVHMKANRPIPDEKTFGKLFLQTEIIAAMTRENADFFGEPRFFSLSFDHFDLYFFLLSRFSRSGVLVIQIEQPYDHEEIVSNITGYLKKEVQ